MWARAAANVALLRLSTGAKGRTRKVGTLPNDRLNVGNLPNDRVNVGTLPNNSLNVGSLLNDRVNVGTASAARVNVGTPSPARLAAETRHVPPGESRHFPSCLAHRYRYIDCEIDISLS